jgi:hypothetical protein
MVAKECHSVRGASERRTNEPAPGVAISTVRHRISKIEVAALTVVEVHADTVVG